MKYLFRLLVVLPIAVILLLFAIANRHVVTVSFIPSQAPGAAFSLTAPLFIVLILTGAAGLLVGGFVTWLRQGRWRRQAREAKAEIDRLRADLFAARAQAAPPSTSTALVVSDQARAA